jgi:NitT/TauT family transport system ATP-binding protein
MNSVILEQISKSYGDLKVLENFSVILEQSKTYAIFGDSGCGKTTLLNIIAGVKKADSGTIYGLGNWHIAYMFQEDRLLPWETVADNIKLVLNQEHTDTNQIIRKVLQLVNLTDFSDYFPNKLSGGMRRRASLARTLAYLEYMCDKDTNQMLILDEPFKGIDIALKQHLIDYIIFNRKLTQITLLVTHDIFEAKYMADVIISINQ